MKLFRSTEEEQQSATAQSAFKKAIEILNPSDPEWSKQVVAKLEGDQSLAALSKRERRKLGEQAFLQYADAALADDHLTEDEQDVLTGLAEVIGFEQSDFQQHDLYTRLQVAKLNDGRLPVVDAPRLMAKRGEVVHLETPAALMHEVAVLLGQRKTVDMPYTKLMGMNMFSDAISFSLSNRQNAPLIKVAMSTDLLAALLNAAIQKSEA